ncbi:CaiB/BaiF CoA-transferase family protein [Kocuria sp. SM24M-10]|uniref:CaiB/BaiF CoA transferase family protein n=1 Tax=Kocuria sp. SM24M-10 TaxID=1660349 RepID=UPI000649D61B|nr:CoA transferase [Kocuria sp. SM24M-10]KLU09114.1 carnitine dehydratase [Kocuria sp. SM24M-10]
MNDRPLDGLTVLDLTTALAGPYATLLLAGLGARVIKIENPATGGDAARNNSPYLTAEGLNVARSTEEDMSVSILSRARNKESLALDLKHPQGKQVFLDLVAQADIVVENYSAGVTARLGIDYATVSEINPAIIYTSISGFGADGGEGRAMDTIVQALSGVMMTAGEPGSGPVRFGLPVGDLVAPLFSVIGTLGAVVQRQRTGHGQYVDVSMLGSLTSLVAAEPFDAYEELGLPVRTGEHVPRLAPFGTFTAADGWFALCAPTDKFAHGVLAAMGRPELIEDPRFAHRDGRVQHADELHGLIAEWASDRPLSEILADLEIHHVPVAPVRDPADAVRDPRVQQRQEVVRLHLPGGGEGKEVYGPGMPFLMSGSDISLDRPAPRLGEHTDTVLQGLLGYTSEQVDALHHEGILQAAPATRERALQ